MKILGKEFQSKQEAIKYMVEHKSELIEMKKSAVKFTDAFQMSAAICDKALGAQKAMHTSTKNDTETTIERTIIGNTYNWMDSHQDVHLDGTFSKSISERKDKIFHLHDHEYKVIAKVGKPIDVYEKQVKWRDLGIDKDGSTTSLMMDSQIRKDMNNMIFNEYKDGQVDQHSVGMYYVKLDLAVNDPDYEKEYKEWVNAIDKIGNREKAEENGYFWSVKEAKLIEISAVLRGSNELTPTIEAKDNEPPTGTQGKESQESTPEQQQKAAKGSSIFLFN